MASTLRYKRWKTAIDKSSDEYAKNHEGMSKLVADLRAKLADWQDKGKERRRQEHRKQKKFLGRERMELLIDEDTPFLEIQPLAGVGWKHVAHGNPVVGGIGLISGVECMIVTSVPTVGAGAASALSNAKWRRFAEIAMENRLPFVSLLESAGADLQQAFDVFHTHPGPFYTLARLSGAGIPVVTVVFGTCIAGGAYMAGMSDYVVMVKGNAQLALAGSKLVQVATGEKSTDEQLGSAAMHTKVSGSSEFFAHNETEAIVKCREILATLTVQKETVIPDAFLPPVESREPTLDPEELLGIVPVGSGHPNFECREVIARIVDSSEFFEFKPEYGPTMVTCWARIYGVPVGILSNNGVIFHQSAQKSTHFINLCNQRGYPIIYLHNVTGFMVGQQYERDGMLKWGSQMINAMSNASVPNISILIGSSFGAAYYAMCGRGYMPRFLFEWPNAKCAVMGPDQLSGVMELLAREKAKKDKKEPDEEKIAGLRAMLKGRIESEMDAFYTSSRLVDDGIIDPRDTRKVLGVCLSVICNRKIEKGPPTGIARL